MTLPESILPSTKVLGKFEQAIIEQVTKYFSGLGYSVYPHSRFNLAWGSIISDIDVLVVKDDEVTVIEVKSSHDNISRAKKQIDAIADYVDFAYVATDQMLKRWEHPSMGLLYLNRENNLQCVVKAKRFKERPSVKSIAALKKKCLLRFLGEGNQAHLLKYDVSNQIKFMGSNASLRRCLKMVAICDMKCETSCPAQRFAARNIKKPSLDSSESFF
ncbi:MAG: hypothetical protein HYY22_07900 [Thaumarchaeota archaeon]|nr:hypothetical protein [Nitrososphaerota archaeon]